MWLGDLKFVELVTFLIIREIVRLRVTSLRDRSRDVEKHFLATINNPMLPKPVFFCGYFHTSSSCSSSVSTTRYKGVKWDKKHVDMVENYSLTEGIQHILQVDIS